MDKTLKASFLSGIDKLITLSQLLSAFRQHRPVKIVFTNGCFDLLHCGHLRFLRYCALCRYVLNAGEFGALVIGLNSDASVRKIKGPGRPIMSELDRAEMLSAYSFVDYVIIFDDPTPKNLIEVLLPDLLIKGSEWAVKVAGQDVVEACGGNVVLYERSIGVMPDIRCTTDIVKKIQSLPVGPKKESDNFS